MTSPCLTCESLEPCSTCVRRLAWEGATDPEPEPKGCATCAEVEWLRLCGETLESIAPRVGFKEWRSLDRHLARHGQIVPPRWAPEHV